MLKKHRIRRLRHRLRMTQEALGDAIGQSQPYVSDLERGMRPVLAVATLERLAQALGVAMETLITADERRRRAARGVPTDAGSTEAVSMVLGPSSCARDKGHRTQDS